MTTSSMDTIKVRYFQGFKPSAFNFNLDAKSSAD
jgi:hypothetical protein